MSMVSLSGYFGQYAQYKIFWNYDFALKYTKKELELIVDLVYQSVLIIFELINFYYMFVVAIAIGVTTAEYEVRKFKEV